MTNLLHGVCDSDSCNVAYLSNGDLEIMNTDWFKNTITIKGMGDDAFRLSSSSGCRSPFREDKYDLTEIPIPLNPYNPLGIQLAVCVGPI